MTSAGSTSQDAELVGRTSDVRVGQISCKIDSTNIWPRCAELLKTFADPECLVQLFEVSAGDHDMVTHSDSKMPF